MKLLMNDKIIGAQKLITSSTPPSLELPRDGDGHGGFSCFACGRSTRPGEPFVCVSRLWYRDGIGNRKAINALSSLQICLPCAFEASGHELLWHNLPKLVDHEFFGFYTYAQQLAYARARELSDTIVIPMLLKGNLLDKDMAIGILDPLFISGGLYKRGLLQLIEPNQCYRCCAHIDLNSSHMEIELGVHADTPSGMKMYNPFTVARYCDPCLRALFRILPDDTMNCRIW